MAEIGDQVRDEGLQVPTGAFTINADLFIVADETITWAPTEFPNLPPAEDDLQYRIDREIRPEQIARDFYGNPRLWWVIAVANNIRNPLTDFKPGLILRIPAPERVQVLLEQGAAL